MGEGSLLVKPQQVALRLGFCTYPAPFIGYHLYIMEGSSFGSRGENKQSSLNGT